MAMNGLASRVLMPDVVDGVNSRQFDVPSGSKVMVVHVPALVGVASTVLVQTQEPKQGEGETPVWTLSTVSRKVQSSLSRSLHVGRARFGS